MKINQQDTQITKTKVDNVWKPKIYKHEQKYSATPKFKKKIYEIAIGKLKGTQRYEKCSRTDIKE